jgi:hypothetical protein
VKGPRSAVSPRYLDDDLRLVDIKAVGGGFQSAARWTLFV